METYSSPRAVIVVVVLFKTSLFGIELSCDEVMVVVVVVVGVRRS